MNYKYLTLFISTLFSTNIFSSSNSLEVSAQVEPGCNFFIDEIVVGSISVDDIDLVKPLLFKPFNIKAQCSIGTQYTITGLDKATTEVPGGMEFVYLRPTKPENNDYMGFHIGRHKVDPTLCNNELNTPKTGIVYSSIRDSFTQHSEHVATGNIDVLPMCIYFYLPTHDRADRFYNHYLTPDSYTRDYTFIFNF